MNKLNRLLSLILIVAISISAYMFVLKIFAERGNSKVEISVSYKEVNALANSLDKSPQEVIDKLKASGVTSLAIEENTVKDLADMGWILVLNGWQLLDYDRLLGTTRDIVRQLVTADDFSPKSYYALTKERDIFDKLKDFMQERGYDIKSYEGGGLYIIQDVNAKGGFTSIGLGFDETAFSLAQDAGLSITVVPKDLASKTPEEMEFLIAQLNGKAINVFLPGNNEMPLDNVSFRMLKGFLKDTNIKLGFDEFLNANDVASMAKELNYSAVRVYNRPPHKWMDEYLIAVRDRNDRLLYLHLFLSGPEDPLSYNVEHISRIKNDITTKGIITDFEFGSSSAFKNIYSNRILSFVSSLGIFWALFKLAKGAGVSRSITTILLSFLFVLLAITAACDFSLFKNAAGLLAAVSFPVLGTYEEMRKEAHDTSNFSTLTLQSLCGFCRSIVITAAGALIVWGIFSGSPALLGLEKFRGIKALYIISYVLLIMLYLKDKNGGFYLKKPIISLGGILGLIAFTGALFVLINRTGNYSIIPIPKWELSFRIWLEQVLWVRPRTKEFLIGFPSMIIAGGLKALGFDNWSKLFYMAALLGQVSMMNTFSHFHISALISIIRSLEGIVIGLILGTAVLGGFYLYEKRRKGDV